MAGEVIMFITRTEKMKIGTIIKRSENTSPQ